MNIDPSVWPFALPVAFALLHTRRMPDDHPFRQTLDRIAALEARAGLASARGDALWRASCAVLTVALTLTGLASLAKWTGLPI